jgi:cellulose synthase/poly-beta-1,6-N-acetylglucosamine synthase-like glycosyltransferase
MPGFGFNAAKWSSIFVALKPLSLLILAIIFFAAVAIQLVYLLVFNIAFSRKRIAPQPTDVPVSVIVCAHDEEENLKQLIPLLLQQDHPEFEVIIVDDRSNDGTYDYLLHETKVQSRLKMVHVNRTPPHVNGKKYSLTLGIKAAQYEWILLTDADCRPDSPNWIKTMSACFTDTKKFVIGFSPYQKEGGLLNAFIRFESLLTAIQYVSYSLLGNPYMAVGRNLAYRKSLFLEKKGFNEHINLTGGDDDVFVNQHARGVETVVCIEKEAVVHSIAKRTWGEFFKQKKRHLSVGKLYRFKHRFLLGIFAITWLLTWFLGIPLAIFSPIKYWIIGIFAFRIIFLTITTQISVKHLGQRFEAWLVPVLDFVFSIYYLSTGFVALVSKKVKWKN